MRHIAFAPPPGFVAAVLAVGLLPLTEPLATAGDSDLNAALDAWRAENGQSWQVAIDSKTSLAEFFYGGRATPSEKPQDDVVFVQTARDFLVASEGMHGVGDSELVFDRITHLPLGEIGSCDKVSIRFRQERSGIPVLNGTVNVLMDTEGGLLSISSHAAPDLEALDVSPSYGADDAIFLASEQFLADAGKLADTVHVPELVVAQVETGPSRRPLLVWRVHVGWGIEDSTMDPISNVYLLDADTGALAGADSDIARYDVSGSVQSNVTPGTGPLHAGSTVVPAPMRNLYVYDSTGTVPLATTDANGDFTITGHSAPLTIRLRYHGTTQGRVQNLSGDEYELTTLLAPVGNPVLMNPTGDVHATAQANAYFWINSLHDWILATNAQDSIWSLFAAGKPEARVNWPTIGCKAEALISEQAVRLSAGGGTGCGVSCGGLCPNKASAHTIVHETGHLLMCLYNAVCGQSSFNEGSADLFARYLHDEPVNLDNCIPSCGERDGQNARRWCGPEVISYDC